MAALELSSGVRESSQFNAALDDVIDATTDFFSPFILRRDLGGRISFLVEALQSTTDHLSARFGREREKRSLHFCDPESHP